MTPVFRHLAWTGALLTAALLVFAAGQRANDAEQATVRNALGSAAFVASAVSKSGTEVLDPLLRKGLEEGQRRITVVVGRSVVADTRGGARPLASESLDDKALYDVAARLAHPSVGGEVPVEIVRREDGSAVGRVGIPGIEGRGVVAVEWAREPVDASLPWALVFPFVIVLAFASRTGRSGIGAALLAQLVVADGLLLSGWWVGYSKQFDVRSFLYDDVWFLSQQLGDLGFAHAVAVSGAPWSLIPRGIAVALAALTLFAFAGYFFGITGRLGRAWRALVEHRLAYGYLAPAMFGLVVLSFVPLFFGLALGFMERRYNVFDFVGLANYVEILGDFDVWRPGNFYGRFLVTVLWTVTNVVLHVSIGLALALLLNDPILKARGVYRVLLIVPWAVPNYITALLWKGLFHRQFGAVNAFLSWLGVDPVAWFQSFWPAFSANLATNTWLGFPFMMVVSLGALQSIPTDLYDAAAVDGAGRWQRFRHVTWPLLLPALVPAVINGVVWTFNMFNVIYLVSGGAPDGGTDILVTEAFRFAFERDRYGLAAAYSTLVFGILLLFTLATNRFTKATKGALE